MEKMVIFVDQDTISEEELLEDDAYSEEKIAEQEGKVSGENSGKSVWDE